MVPGQGRQESLSSSESASVESESNNEQGIKHNDAARITEYVNTGNGNDPDGVMRVIERVDPNGDNPYKELQERLGNDTAEEKKDMYEDLKATQDDRAELVPEAKEKTDEDLRHTLEEAQNAIIEAKGADPKYSRLNEEAIDVGEGLFNHIAEKGGGPNLPNVFYGLKQEEKTSEEKQAETPPPNVVEFQREVYNQTEREEEQGLAA